MDVDDGLGNLYRAALMIGKGNVEIGKLFLEKAGKYGERIGEDKNNFVWAEKILDEYYRLRWG